MDSKVTRTTEASVETPGKAKGTGSPATFPIYVGVLFLVVVIVAKLCEKGVLGLDPPLVAIFGFCLLVIGAAEEYRRAEALRRQLARTAPEYAIKTWEKVARLIGWLLMGIAFLGTLL